ncbi:MAG: HesB/IscA family protein [Bacteroidia bacterium]
MISISEKAAEKVKQMLLEPEQSGKNLIRVSVVSGGCSGLSYKMDFDSQSTETDEKFEDKGLTLICDKKSFFYLIGTELDYSEGLQGKGFHFVNPNASRTCACGESFSL